MKKTFLPALLLPFIALAPLRAQMESNTNSLSNEGNPPPPPEERHGPMAQLSDTERAQLKEAHDKAIEQDPSLQQRMKEAHDTMEAARNAMNDAMIKIDPSVEAILAKIVPPKREWKKEGGPNSAGKEPSRPWKRDNSGAKGMGNLTEAERQQVKALHDQVKNDPAVAAARDAMKQATTPDARKEAEKTLQQARREAMLNADPSIAPILDKLQTRHAGESAAPMTQ